MATFREGVQWGMFLGTYTEDTPQANAYRDQILFELIDIIDDHPGEPLARTLREAVAERWANLQCHGILLDGYSCPDCGACNPGGDE